MLYFTVITLRYTIVCVLTYRPENRLRQLASALEKIPEDWLEVVPVNLLGIEIESFIYLGQRIPDIFY